MTTDEMAQALYNAEINFSVSCFFDDGWERRLGDNMNGLGGANYAETFPDAVRAVYEEARTIFPGLRS